MHYHFQPTQYVPLFRWQVPLMGFKQLSTTVLLKARRVPPALLLEGRSGGQGLAVRWEEGWPVERVERLLTALHVTFKWLLLRVHSHVDPEAVGGEEGLAAALLITDKGVLSSVSLLVSAQVACCAVGAGTALKGALVPLYLETEDTSATWQRAAQGLTTRPPCRAWFPGDVDDTEHGKPPLTTQ